MPEVLEEGVTGFLVESVDEAVKATRQAAALPRARCRSVFEERFTAERMAREYVSVYERLAGPTSAAATWTAAAQGV